MQKLASSHELQGELERLLKAAQAPNPSRVMLAAELRTLADRLAAKVDWAKKGDKWMARAEYSDGSKYEWSITDEGKVSVKTPKGSYDCKKDFAGLDAAKKYCARFIDRADGGRQLEDVLSHDFTRA